MTHRHRAAPQASRRTVLAAGAAWTLGALGACSVLPGGERPGAAGAAGSSALQLRGAGAASPPPTAPASPPAPAPVPPPAPTPTFDRTALSTTDPASPWVVVNKQHPLEPRDWAPAEVVEVAGERVSSAIAPDLQALLDHAAGDGVRLPLVSGYRSYAYQVGVHRRSVARQGQAAADRYSARAGFSEHQTGLAVDFASAARPACTLADCYEETPEAAWLGAHAGEHGFLRRYTVADQPVTGYNPEAWHYRWVGHDLVAAMAAAGATTLEAFFGVTGGPDYAAS